MALDAIPSPAVILDASNTILRANRAARAELSASPSTFAELFARADQQGGQASFEVIMIQRGWRLAVQRVPRRLDADAIQRAAERWRLTPRQSRVLRLLAEGQANKTIAARLGCAENTVEYHVTQLLKKAAAENRTELVAELWRVARSPDGVGRDTTSGGAKKTG